MSSSSMSTTAHEAAKKKTNLSDIWVRMERAKTEVKLLQSMLQEGLGVPQVMSMINKLGQAMKSTRGGGLGGTQQGGI